MTKIMTENEIETPPVRPPAWRDNEAVLWLVRIGFLLQFYIPAIVCCYIVYDIGTRPPVIVSEDDPYYADYEFGKHLSEQFFKFSIYTLILLVVQWTFFSLILRFGKLRSAEGVLWLLIAINAIHSLAWLMIMWPLTLIRLIPPNAFYYIAICIEARITRHDLPANTEPDTP